MTATAIAVAAAPRPRHWTDAEKTLAAEQWREGRTATEIADALFQQFGRRRSRSAVLATVARLGVAAAPRPRHWTDAEKTLAAEQWREGRTATEIADALFQQFGRQRSRSAVFAIVARLGVDAVAGNSAAWTDAEKTLAAEQWREGRSATEIAAALFQRFGRRRSRNAVIGKVTRMGVAGETRRAPHQPASRRPRLARPKPAPKPRAGPKARPAPTPTPLPALDPIAAHAAGPTAMSILQLELRHCRFPVGEATGAEQLYCGQRKAGGDSAYCTGHRQLSGGARLVPKGYAK